MAKSKFPPRGIRNNNPLNIRRSKNKWLGEVDYLEMEVKDKTGENGAARFYDKSFCQFKTRVYGYRAAFRLIKTYMDKYGCNTIRKIVTRWAPPSENNTNNYINFVSDYALRNADCVIDPKDGGVLVSIVCAMATQENGWEYNPKGHFAHWQDVSKAYIMVFGEECV